MISETFCLSNLYKCAYVFLLRPRIDSGTFLDKKRKIICLKIKRRDGALRGSLVRSKKNETDVPSGSVCLICYFLSRPLYELLRTKLHSFLSSSPL